MEVCRAYGCMDTGIVYATIIYIFIFIFIFIWRKRKRKRKRKNLALRLLCSQSTQMPTYVLSIKCELENIERLTPLESNHWKFDVEGSSGDIKEGITVSSVDEMELDNSRGIANFVMKWHGDREQSHIKIVPIKKVDGTYKATDSGNYVQILAMECRGLVPVKWHPMCDFSATSTGGFKFDEVDLSDDWAEYDEENDDSVSIMGLESKIERG